MTGKQDKQNWIASAVTAVLALVIVCMPSSAINRENLTLPLIVLQLLLPVAAAITGALHGWSLTAAMCILAAAAGWKVFPAEGLPVTLFWCAASGLTACLPLKNRLFRPALRTCMCLAAWGIGLFILLRMTGGQIVNGLAQAACDYVQHSPDSTDILLRAYSAGYVRLQGTEALAPAVRLMGNLVILPETQKQMLYSLRVSLEEILPSLLCSLIVYHTTLTVLLSTVLPDWQRRKHGERGEFAPLDQWYMPRRLGMAVFALCIGWIIALTAQGGIGAYLGWLCADVFRAAFMLQGICWMQWMGKRMGVRSTVRNIWSVILSVIMPLIPMIMGMIDQSRDARHLRPKEEADQE